MSEESNLDTGVIEPTELTEEEAASLLEARFTKNQPEPEEKEPEEKPEEEEQESETDSEEEQPKTDDLVELEIDGEVWQVPKKLQEGYLRTQDYTKKTQEVAQLRQTVEQEKQTLEHQKRALAEYVQLANANLDQVSEIKSLDARLEQYQKLDWNSLIDSDPVEAIKLDKQMRDLITHRDGLIQQWSQTQNILKHQQAQSLQQAIYEGHQVLAKEIPDWNTEKAKTLATFGTDYGFTQEEMSSVIDPRMVKVLHDAYQYRQLKAGKAEVEKKVSQAPKVLKASNTTSQKTQARQQEDSLKSKFKKSGSLDDAAALIYAKMTRKK